LSQPDGWGFNAGQPEILRAALDLRVELGLRSSARRQDKAKPEKRWYEEEIVEAVLWLKQEGQQRERKKHS
jgi:hypothetical protein